MIAVKREVAAWAKAQAGFPWSECQVAKTGDKSLYNVLSYQELYAPGCVMGYDTHGRVYSHRLSYYIYCSVRKGGDFFYGKSNYENHP